MSDVIAHLEQYLGGIQEGWTCDISRNEMPFQVVRMEASPIEHTDVYSTIGLSNFPLKSRRSGKVIRLELVMMVRANKKQLGIPGILQQVGMEAMSRGDAYLRGDIIGPRNELFIGSRMRAIYVSLPAYFPDGFSSFIADNVGAVVIAWLIPISAREAEFVSLNGWEKFEDVLTERNPDLVDVFRDDLIV